jgi:hypothetical protein
MRGNATSSKTLGRRERLNQMLFEALLFGLAFCLAQLYSKYSYLRYGGLDIATRALGLVAPGLIDYAQFAARTSSRHSSSSRSSSPWSARCFPSAGAS